MRKGMTLIEVLVAIAIVGIVVALVASAINRRRTPPEIINVQPVGEAEQSGERRIVKIPAVQIETYLAKIPSTVRIVQVVPVYSMEYVTDYLIITEN